MDTRHGRGPTAHTRTNGNDHVEELAKGADPRGVLHGALTKDDLQNLLFRHLGLSKRECREMVGALFEEMRIALESGEPVKLEGFGRFQPKARPRRWARDLRSGERIRVAERRVVTFRASRKITGSIRNPRSDERSG